jgi:hypothetical protein
MLTRTIGVYLNRGMSLIAARRECADAFFLCSPLLALRSENIRNDVAVSLVLVALLWSGHEGYVRFQLSSGQ